MGFQWIQWISQVHRPFFPNPPIIFSGSCSTHSSIASAHDKVIQHITRTVIDFVRFFVFVDARGVLFCGFCLVCIACVVFLVCLWFLWNFDSWLSWFLVVRSSYSSLVLADLEEYVVDVFSVLFSAEHVDNEFSRIRRTSAANKTSTNKNSSKIKSKTNNNSKNNKNKEDSATIN